MYDNPEERLNYVLDEITKVLNGDMKGAKKLKAIWRIVVDFQQIAKS